jgi:nucleoside-triphosphatase THEP1
MSRNPKDKRIFLVTGPVQGGKSTFLSALTALLKKRGLAPGGFLCPGTIASGNRSEFYLKNILTGMVLPMGSAKETSGWFKYRRFWFNPVAFKKGKEWIRECLGQEAQVLVIDEVGPMELEGSGWSELLDALVVASVPVQLWSVRENILQEVIQRWNIDPVHLIRIDSTDADQVANVISKMLENQEE